MARASEILFRIFYSTSFTIVFLLLIAFICVSPADALYRSYKRRRLIDIFLIAGVYVVTALIAILLYASRLYTTRSVLKDIPKTYIPIDRDDLPGKKTWRLIAETVRRSAVIAHQTRPRAYRIEVEVEGAEARIEKLLQPETRKNDGAVAVSRVVTRWGPISHPGWSSPANDELPDLQYETVVAELTDLIEAKAVSLAPIDPLATPAEDGRPVPDERIIEALARPASAGMRLYIGKLIRMEVLEGSELVTSFLTLYERARFAIQPLSEDEFKNLMRLFAEVLRTMKQPNTDMMDLDSDLDGSDESDDDDVDDDDEEEEEDENDIDDQKSISKKSIASSHYSSASSISASVRHHSITPRRQQSQQGSVRVRTRGGEG